MILYNGVSGGLGKYLPETLQRHGAQSHAIRARLEDRAGLRAELASLKPPTKNVTLLQIAARVSVPACEADPAGTQKINVDDTRATVEDFIDWAHAQALSPKVIYVSSGHVYAAQPPGVRIDEGHSTAPRSVYARTKLQAEQELTELAAKRSAGFQIARVFGLIAPAQPANYVLPGLIRRVRETKLDGVPGLSYVRDYLDARDVCEDLLSLTRVDATGLVNVCSGDGVTLRAILQQIIRTLRPSEEAQLLALAKEAPGRADDVPSILGNPTRFTQLTGTEPRRISLAETVRDACASA